MQRIVSGLATLLLVIGVGAAHASIIQIGSAFTLTGNNAPGFYSTTTTFGGTASVDSGAATLTMSQVATGPNGEWDIWSLRTTSGGPIVGDSAGYWNIIMNYVLSQPVFFDQVVNQWTLNGSPVSPISNFGGICCAVSNNPATGGEAYYGSGFSDPIAAGTFTNWTQIYVNPYSFAFSGGIPADANGFTWALHFTLQNPTATPLPAALPLFATGLGGLGLLGWRRKRKPTAAIGA